MKSNKTTPHCRSTTILSAIWHGIFFGVMLFPQFPGQLLGSLAWPVYVSVLSLLAMVLLMLYFLSLVDEHRPSKWNSWILLNSIMICLPLYFLWWNYLQ